MAVKQQAPYGVMGNSFLYFPFRNSRQPILILILVGIIFYCTSLGNEYALDDGIIIHQNDHVIKGVKGIKAILTKDAFESFYRHMGALDQLPGGRYRPLSVVSFAIEQEFIGTYPDGIYPADCWDQNKNRIGDAEEDINGDGIFNEVDCQVKGAFLRHFNNMWMYILGVVLLYTVLRNYVFRSQHDYAFLSALIFLCHPMHTEAIANVKSRDEIFSLIFVPLTFLFAFRYLESKRTRDLFYAAFMFLLALLSKEYAVVLLGLVPLSIYMFTKNNFDIAAFAKPLAGLGACGLGGLLLIKAGTPGAAGTAVKFAAIIVAGAGAYFFYKHYKPFKSVFTVFGVFMLCFACMVYVKYSYEVQNPYGNKPVYTFWLFPFVYVLLGIFLLGSKAKGFERLVSWYYFVMLFYLAMRLMAVHIKPGVPDSEILNNPYLLADGQERFCTKAYVLLKYFLLLWFPHPLSSDYSYNTIAYRHFSDWDFILSIILHVALVVLGIKLILKKHVLGFAIAVYIFFLIMIGNVVMDIGATMGERLMFHSSIGFSVALAWLILKGLDKIKMDGIVPRRVALFAFLGVVVFLYGCKTWERNFDWKNDITLFIKDATTKPNSVLVLGNAGARWIDLSNTKFFNRKPGETASLPFSSYKDEMLSFKVSDKELRDGISTKDSVLLPLNSEKGRLLSLRERSLYKGIACLKHAVELHPRYVNGYLNLGLAYFHLHRDREAFYYWKHAQKLYPNNPYLKNYYINYYNQLLQRGYQMAMRGHSDSAAVELNKCVVLDNLNPEGWYNLGGAYFNLGHYSKAKACWQEALRLKPDHAMAQQGLKSLTPQMLHTTVVPTPIKKY